MSISLVKPAPARALQNLLDRLGAVALVDDADRMPQGMAAAYYAFTGVAPVFIFASSESPAARLMNARQILARLGVTL